MEDAQLYFNFGPEQLRFNFEEQDKKEISLPYYGTPKGKVVSIVDGNKYHVYEFNGSTWDKIQ